MWVGEKRKTERCSEKEIQGCERIYKNRLGVIKKKRDDLQKTGNRRKKEMNV